MPTKKPAATPAEKIETLHRRLSKEGTDFIKRTDALVAELQHDVAALDEDTAAATNELHELAARQTEEFDEALAELLLHAQD